MPAMKRNIFLSLHALRHSQVVPIACLARAFCGSVLSRCCCCPPVFAACVHHPLATCGSPGLAEGWLWVHTWSLTSSVHAVHHDVRLIVIRLSHVQVVLVTCLSSPRALSLISRSRSGPPVFAACVHHPLATCGSPGLAEGWLWWKKKSINDVNHAVGAEEVCRSHVYRAVQDNAFVCDFDGDVKAS